MGSQTNAGTLQHRKDRNRELATKLNVNSVRGQYWDQAPGSTSQEEYMYLICSLWYKEGVDCSVDNTVPTY